MSDEGELGERRQNGKMQKKKARRRNWREGETTALCQFVERHKTALFGKGKHCSAPVEQRKKKYWLRAAQYLKSQGFCRDAEEAQRKWGDMKQRALKYKSQRNLTGGGVNPLDDIKPSMEAVLAILARESVEGVVGSGEEAGFSSSQSTVGSQNETACILFSGMTEQPSTSRQQPSLRTSPVPTGRSIPQPTPPPMPQSAPSLPQSTKPTKQRMTSSSTASTPCQPSPAEQLVELEKERMVILNRNSAYLERIAVSLEIIAQNSTK